MSELPVAVVWKDSVVVGSGGWVDRQELLDHAHAVNRTVAFLLAETDEALLLAGSIDARNGNVAGAIVVPRCAVVSCEPLPLPDAAMDSPAAAA